ncbi:hypothetical protein CBR_g18966 [Chara braunii]|uniref:Anaphase-promoting complex subunit 4 WD40 domain-containing protein n=1 Tax=Chara braunii TaxID=69332 RepID=A0A388KWX9_CHABU|nr:hypothetical protein CBR_g18966 [Chara braunii]|eukprot:GBG74555.1 hypothetical protein CBR_g18966 [Chara braunii]
MVLKYVKSGKEDGGKGSGSTVLFVPYDDDDDGVEDLERKMAMELRRVIVEAHDATILCVAFNPWRREIFSGGQDSLIKVWDMDSGRHIRTFQKHRGWVTDLLFPLPVRFLFSSSLDGHLLVWTEKGKEVQCVTIGEPIFCLQWNAKRRQVIAGGDSMLFLYRTTRLSFDDLKAADGRDARIIRLVATINSHNDIVRGICCSKNGKIFSASYDRSICTYESERPKDSNLAIEGDRPRVIWSKFKKCHKGAISCLALDTDNNWLISGGLDGTMKIWSHEGRCLDTFENFTDSITSIAYLTSTKTYWVTGKSRKMIAYDPRTPAEITSYIAQTSRLKDFQLTKVYQCPQSDLVIGISHNDELIMWRYNPCAALRVMTGHSDWVESVAIVNRQAREAARVETEAQESVPSAPVAAAAAASQDVAGPTTGDPVPGGAVSGADGPSSGADGASSGAEGPVSGAGDAVSAPGGAVTDAVSGPGGTVAAPDGVVSGGGGAVSGPGSAVSVSGPRGTVAAPDGVVSGGGGAVSASGSAVSGPGGGVSASAGAVSGPGSTVAAPGGVVSGGGGGAVSAPGGGVSASAGAVSGAGGTVAAPGGVVSGGGGGAVSAPGGGVSASAGAISSPSGAVSGGGGAVSASGSAVSAPAVEFLLQLVQFLLQAVQCLVEVVQFLLRAVQFLLQAVEFLLQLVQFLVQVVQFLLQAVQLLVEVVRFLHQAVQCGAVSAADGAVSTGAGAVSAPDGPVTAAGGVVSAPDGPGAAAGVVVSAADAGHAVSSVPGAGLSPGSVPGALPAASVAVPAAAPAKEEPDGSVDGRRVATLPDVGGNTTANAVTAGNSEGGKTHSSPPLPPLPPPPTSKIANATVSTNSVSAAVLPTMSQPASSSGHPAEHGIAEMHSSASRGVQFAPLPSNSRTDQNGQQKMEGVGSRPDSSSHSGTDPTGTNQATPGLTGTSPSRATMSSPSPVQGSQKEDASGPSVAKTGLMGVKSALAGDAQAGGQGGSEFGTATVNSRQTSAPSNDILEASSVAKGNAKEGEQEEKQRGRGGGKVAEKGLEEEAKDEEEARDAEQPPDIITTINVYTGGADGLLLNWLSNTQHSYNLLTINEEISGHDGSILSIDYCEDLDLLITGSEDRTIRIWNLDGKRFLPSGDGNPFEGNVLTGHADRVVGVVCCKEQVLVSVSHDMSIRWWDLNTRQETHAVEKAHNTPITSVAYSADRDELATCASEPLAKIWSSDTYSLKATLTGLPGDIANVKWSSMQKGIWVTGADDGTVAIWSAETGKPVTNTCFTGESVTCLCVDEINEVILAGMSSNLIRALDIDLSTTLRVYAGHSDAIRCIVHIKEKAQYLSASWDKTLRIWLAYKTKKKEDAWKDDPNFKEGMENVWARGGAMGNIGGYFLEESCPPQEQYISNYEREHPLVYPKTMVSYVGFTVRLGKGPSRGLGYAARDIGDEVDGREGQSVTTAGGPLTASKSETSLKSSLPGGAQNQEPLPPNCPEILEARLAELEKALLAQFYSIPDDHSQGSTDDKILNGKRARNVASASHTKGRRRKNYAAAKSPVKQAARATRAAAVSSPSRRGKRRGNRTKPR